MMGGFGVIDQMKKSYEQNRNLLGKKKSLKELYEASGGKSTTSKRYKYKQPTAAEIRKLRARLKEENQLKKIKLSIVSVVIASVIGYIFYLVFYT